MADTTHDLAPAHAPHHRWPGRERRARGPHWSEAMVLAHRTGAEAASARASALTAPSAPDGPVSSDTPVAPVPSGPRLPPVPLAAAFGRTLSSDLRALFDVPHYDSSAMDGYAVAGQPPWLLDDPPTPPRPSAPLPPGRARTVVTGGPVPTGASGVVRSEYTVSAPHEDGVRIDLRPGAPAAELAPGRHIRRAGREAAAGDLLAAAGRPLTPPLLAMAGIAGHDDVPVLPPVTAALLLTGDEVRTSGTPAVGEVRDAFEVQLPHVLRAAGIEVAVVRRIGDDRAVTSEALAELVELADVVVTTGGTGRSRADHVRAELMERAADAEASADPGGGAAAGRAAGAGEPDSDGAERPCADGADAAERPCADGAEARPSARIIIDELGMRPGHPTMLALLGRDASGASWPVPVLALPGNPLAAMAAMRIVGSGLLRGLRGTAPEVPLTVPVAEDLPAEKVDRLVPARPAESAEPGRESAWRPVAHVASNMMRGLTAGQGWLVLPTRPVRTGERVPFLPLEW